MVSYGLGVDRPSGMTDGGDARGRRGEAGTVTRIRRRLVQDLDIDRKTVAFLGYWRQGSGGGVSRHR